MVSKDDQLAFRLADFTGDNRFLSRPIAVSRPLVPRNLELGNSGENLRWRIDFDDNDTLDVATNDWGILDGFVKLADANAEDILHYARRYGLLEICEHHLPRGHNPANRTPLFLGHEDEPGGHSYASEKCKPLYETTAHDWLWEPLSLWRSYARLALAILRVAERILHRQMAASEEWQILTPPTFRDRQTEFGQRLMVSSRLDIWLQNGNITPTFRWSHSGPAMLWEPAGLFGVLGLQLASVVGNEKGFVFCGGCDALLTSPPMPQGDRRVFCDDCRKAKVPAKLAAKGYRLRKKERQTSTHN